MSIRLHRLVVTGPERPDAALDLKGQSHLVFGPTDTGKSYVVECLRYGLGGSERPRDVGYSEGYTRIALQLSVDDDVRFTLFRDLVQGTEAAYEGFVDVPSQISPKPLQYSIAELVVKWSHGADRVLLTKSGTRSAFAAGDLRYLSVFDEIETLDKVPLVGKDNLLKMRRRSAVALVLSGGDDSQAILAPSTDQRNIAKGHIEALEEEIQALRARLPDATPKKDVDAALSRTTVEIERVGSYLQANVEELAALKSSHAGIERDIRETDRLIIALVEAESRFKLLDLKYQSDLERLQALSSAAAVATAFETRPCPLCGTDLSHQVAHAGAEEDQTMLRVAAQAESNKIVVLRRGLTKALKDVSEDLLDLREQFASCLRARNGNLEAQASLIQPVSPSSNVGLSELTERKSLLAMAARDLERIEELTLRVATMRVRAKRQKQVVERNLSASAMQLCPRIKALLDLWAVPGVGAVSFDEEKADICINQRDRISFGKGKRGIFLAAYVVALMEHALGKGYPHLGLVAIDSPIVTYKDPKHGSQDSEEALDETVKDRFYAWLSDRTEPGQVIVFENDEPLDALKERLPFTEFVGTSGLDGRVGFFPT